MKTKKINRTLCLNKKTIVDLDNAELRAIHGGATLYDTMCVTCFHICTTDLHLSCIHTGCPDPITTD